MSELASIIWIGPLTKNLDSRRISVDLACRCKMKTGQLELVFFDWEPRSRLAIFAYPSPGKKLHHRDAPLQSLFQMDALNVADDSEALDPSRENQIRAVVTTRGFVAWTRRQWPQRPSHSCWWKLRVRDRRWELASLRKARNECGAEMYEGLRLSVRGV